MKVCYSEAIVAGEKKNSSFLVIPKILLPQSEIVGSQGFECETCFKFTLPFSSVIWKLILFIKTIISGEFYANSELSWDKTF